MNDHHQGPPPDYARPGPGTPGPGSVHSGMSHPPQHQTTVTMTTDPTPGGQVTEINLNIGYYKTLPGILKLVQLILGIICMACGSPAREYVGESYGVSNNHWFLFVVVTSFIITLLWCFFYLLQLKESIHMNLPFSWLKLEYFYTVVVTIAYAIAFIVILAGFGYCAGSSPKCDARVAAGFFAILNTIAYGIGAYILYNDYKATPPELQ